jgi:hypothetical protein
MNTDKKGSVIQAVAELVDIVPLRNTHFHQISSFTHICKDYGKGTVLAQGRVRTEAMFPIGYTALIHQDEGRY